MLTGGGLLLEHFARLATIVMGTSAAVVGVRDRRRGQAPRRIAYGLSQSQMACLDGIEEILDADPLLTVVPDLTEDARFAGEATRFIQHDLRFLAHSPCQSSLSKSKG